MFGTKLRLALGCHGAEGSRVPETTLSSLSSPAPTKSARHGLASPGGMAKYPASMKDVSDLSSSKIELGHRQHIQCGSGRGVLPPLS